ncbi:MAG: MFS transporter, partial [Pirellulales bacterium]
MNRSEYSPPDKPHDENPYVSPEPDDRPGFPASANEELPFWLANRSFWSMTVTQMLGAFNDTIFKQFVLLLLVRVAVTPGGEAADLQWIGLAIFSLPFVLLSGTAGWLADRVSKWNVIVLSKIGEIVVMLAGVAAFATMRPVSYQGEQMLTTGLPWLVLAVLCLMGVQSTFFGPSKYAILPEISRTRDLPAFNGVFQMTTFVSLIVGVAVGGYLLDLFRGRLWGAAAVCVVIA